MKLGWQRCSTRLISISLTIKYLKSFLRNVNFFSDRQNPYYKYKNQSAHKMKLNNIN